MNEKELIKLGFVDKSYEDDGCFFTQFTLTTDDFKIEYYGYNMIEMKIPYVDWFEIPNCKTIEDLKCLIKIFTK